MELFRAAFDEAAVRFLAAVVIAAVSLWLVATHSRRIAPIRFEQVLQHIEEIVARLECTVRGLIRFALQVIALCWWLKGRSPLGRADVAISCFALTLVVPPVWEFLLQVLIERMGRGTSPP